MAAKEYYTRLQKEGFIEKIQNLKSQTKFEKSFSIVKNQVTEKLLKKYFTPGWKVEIEVFFIFFFLFFFFKKTKTKCF